MDIKQIYPDFPFLLWWLKVRKESPAGNIGAVFLGSYLLKFTVDFVET